MRKVRRLVFLFAGFEPHDAEEQRARFAYAAAKTGPLWSSSFEVGPLEPGLHGCRQFHVGGWGAGWESETEVIVCDWSDFLKGLEGRSPVLRFAEGLWAMAGFAANGTFFRYLRTGWRYGFFFLYPVFLIVAALLPLLLLSAGAGPGAAGALITAGLMWLFVRKLHLLVLLDNWSFARRLALERDAAVLGRADQFKAALVTRSEAFRAEAADGEVLIAAHSLGAYFGAMALGGALAELKPGGAAPAMLLAGSSLLKIALHPSAIRLRAAAAAIARSEVQWLDVQSLTDVLNFYRADPAAVLGLTAKRPPVLQFVRFRAMLTPETYHRIKRDWLRVHRQFVLAAERRTNYSFHMMLAGPFYFTEIMENRGLPQDFAVTAQIRGPEA
jgi:hypothetical protein